MAQALRLVKGLFAALVTFILTVHFLTLSEENRETNRERGVRIQIQRPNQQTTVYGNMF